MSNNKKTVSVQMPTEEDDINEVEEIKNQAKAKTVADADKLTSRICIATTKENSDAIKEIAYQKRLSVNSLLNNLIREYIRANKTE